MTHEDAGKYSAKHPAGTILDPAIAAALKQTAVEGRIACAAAHSIAEDLGVAPSEIGTSIDLLEYRIIECQLGLFGYAPERKIVRAADVVTDEVRARLEHAAADGEISCASCWEIAQTLDSARIDVAAACELLKLKIRPCQLGAF